MRAIIFTLLCACAQQPPPPANAPKPVNVAAVRDEIQKVDQRKIVSMGHVDESSAVVFTQEAGVRNEETWLRTPDGWKLRDTKVVALAP